jgi:hypothetical protein
VTGLASGREGGGVSIIRSVGCDARMDVANRAVIWQLKRSVSSSLSVFVLKDENHQPVEGFLAADVEAVAVCSLAEDFRVGTPCRRAGKLNWKRS